MTEQHADDCPGTCPRWIASGLPTCIDVCQCQKTKDTAPDFVKERGNVRCWWKTKVGRITSRCPCWGGRRDGRPGDCCSHHSANPAYLLTPDGMLAEPDAVLQAAAEMPEDPDERPADADSIVWDDGEAWATLRAERRPYTRRWKPAELVCEHPAPAKGIHCSDCHATWATDMTFGMHRPLWTKPCRRPEDLRDVDTGVMLIVRNADGAWVLDWAANAA